MKKFMQIFNSLVGIAAIAFLFVQFTNAIVKVVSNDLTQPSFNKVAKAPVDDYNQGKVLGTTNDVILAATAPAPCESTDVGCVTPTYYTLTVSKIGSGTIISSDGKINCGTDCSESYTAGTSATLTATATSESFFNGWSGGGCSGTSTCRVTLNSNNTVTATFKMSGDPIITTLDATEITNTTARLRGKVNLNGKNYTTAFSTFYYKKTTDINLPVSCFNIVYGGSVASSIPITQLDKNNLWGDQGVEVVIGDGNDMLIPSLSPNTNYSYCITSYTQPKIPTLTYDDEVKSFTTTGGEASYTLTVTKGGTGTGTIVSSPSGINCGSTCSASFAPNTSVILTATPTSGSIFGSWEGCISNNNQCTISMTSARSVTANFIGPTPSINLTVTKLGNGSGTVFEGTVLEEGSVINCGTKCSASFLNNSQSITLTATPDHGSMFTGWGGNCSGTGLTCSLVMNTSKNVTASFTTSTALQPGGLYKLADQPSIHYLAADYKRYIFPYIPDWADYKKVLYSWGFNENNIQTVSSSQLAQYAIGGNVTVRPGTHLIQRLPDSGSVNVYAVSYPNILHLVAPDKLPILYGTAWVDRVLKIPEVFFVNYTIGSPVGSRYPDGTQLSLNVTPYGHYLIYEGKKKFISQDTWISERLGGYRVSIASVDSYLFGTELVGAVPCLGDPSQTTTCNFSGLGTMNKQVTTTTSSATITWQTNLPSDSRVQYSLDASYATEAVSTDVNVTNHSVTITGLSPNTWYNYRASSALMGGARVYSDGAVFQTGGTLTNNFRIISPNGGEWWLLGKTYTIGWSTTGIPSIYKNASIGLELVRPDGTVAADWPLIGSVFGTEDSRFGRASWTVPSDSTLAAQTYRIRIKLGISNQTSLYGISDSPVFFERTVQPIYCSSTSSIVKEGPLGNSTFGNLGLDIFSHPEILKYRIQWSGGGWSDWYTPGVDDVDWKTNDNGTKRRVWGYFGDHMHEYEKCVSGTTLPDFIVTDIKIEERANDIAPYIYTTVKNIGGSLSGYNILGTSIEDLDTGKVYSTGTTESYPQGWIKELSSGSPIVQNKTGIYRLKAKVDNTGENKGLIPESNESNNELTKIVSFISTTNKITITSPKEGDRWIMGNAEKIQWEYPDEVMGKNLRVKVIASGVDFSGLTVSKELFSNADILCKASPCKGEFVWQIPRDFTYAVLPAHSYKMQVIVDDPAYPISGLYFYALSGEVRIDSNDSIFIQAPAKGDKMKIGDTYKIKWRYPDQVLNKSFRYTIRMQDDKTAKSFFVGDSPGYAKCTALPCYGEYSWLVKKDIPVGDTYRLNVNAQPKDSESTSGGLSVYYEGYSNYFSIVSNTTPKPEPKPLPPVSVPVSPEALVAETKLLQRIAQLEYRVTELERGVVESEKSLVQTVDPSLTSRVAGKILLQVEGKGEAWYVDKDTSKKFYLRDGETAYAALQAFGLGISNEDLAKIKISTSEQAVVKDSDGDGLDDQFEIAIGTDPFNKDTDNDGYEDGLEVASGYSPLGTGKATIDA
ncbi:MAG: fibronectin type III domain-containing protein, partial [Patescibacteria group bacterium]